MESDEDFRTVRVYTKKYTSKDKDGNTVEKESQQKQVSLKKEDPFIDNELVKVLAQKDYENLLENQFSDEKLEEFDNIIREKDAQIETLQAQIQTLKGSFFDDVGSLKEQLTDKEELLRAKDEIHELNKKITKIDDERVAIFKELDYKNRMILAYNVELNKSILNAINVVIDEARDNINGRNTMLVKDLKKSIEKSKHDVNEKNKAIAYDIKATVEDMNEQIRNTSTLKMILNKNKINLRVPVDDLLKPFDFDFDVEQLLSGQALELDAAEILKEVMPKLPEPFSKYIDTLEDEPETIDVSSKNEE
ncbi:coiled-coil domain-containing protein [Methanobrevibacter sp.]|uniref:coiled-coil domain-containing protein n=1 Tax=Methanobrevibacter sp. TaxID=66852 RepID=UPI003890E6C4